MKISAATLKYVSNEYISSVGSGQLSYLGSIYYFSISGLKK